MSAQRRRFAIHVAGPFVQVGKQFCARTQLRIAAHKPRGPCRLTLGGHLVRVPLPVSLFLRKFHSEERGHAYMTQTLWMVCVGDRLLVQESGAGEASCGGGVGRSR